MLEHYCGVSPLFEKPASAQVLITGSNLDVLPEKGWKGIVAGAGMLHERTRVDLSKATVLGLRGLLSADRVNGLPKDYVIGDPGLLASELVMSEPKKYKLGVVPHWTDKDLFPKELSNSKRYKYAEPILIDTLDDPLKVIKMIGSCEKIIASSLHGIIVADSFGIPRRVETFPAMFTNPYEGTTFKFEDYASAIGTPISFGELKLASREIVDTRKSEIFDMFKIMRGILNETN